MRLIGAIFIMLPAFYLLSFVKYSWKNKKLPAVGALIIAILSIVIPVIVMFFIKYE